MEVRAHVQFRPSLDAPLVWRSVKGVFPVLEEDCLPLTPVGQLDASHVHPPSRGWRAIGVLGSWSPGGGRGRRAQQQHMSSCPGAAALRLREDRRGEHPSQRQLPAPDPSSALDATLRPGCSEPNHGVQRGGRSRQRCARREGERQEAAPVARRRHHRLAHLLQYHHDRRVSASGGGRAG